MAETKREEDSQASTTSSAEQCSDQQPQPAENTSNTQPTSHKQASSGDTMHTKLAGKDLPTPTSSARSPPPPAVPPPPPSSSTSAAAPDIEITDESGLPKNSEPNSPLSEEDFSSGGEQVPFHDDLKGYIPQEFGGSTSPYYMIPPLPNGVNGGAREDQASMMPAAALASTAWASSGDVGMPEGSYVHVMDAAPFLHHSQPMDGHMTSDPMSPPPEGEGLRTSLVSQLEYYFSKENLSSDKYLLSQMDGDHYVSVSVIAQFTKVKSLTTDVNLILDAIRESHQLQLDDSLEKVRAIPEKRCVLILREIPKETPPEQIEGLFSSDHCPNFSTCEFAENDCWYITFDSEENTQKAFAYLREEVRDFLGQPIRARIKGTIVQRPSSVTKKTHYTYPSVQNVYNGQQQMQYFSQPMSQWSPYYPGDPSYMPYVNGYHPPQGFGGPPNHYQGHHPLPHPPHPPPTSQGGGGDRYSGGGGGARMMGGRGYGNHGNYSGNHGDRSERRGNSGGGGGVSNGSVGGGGGGGGVREEREGRKSGGGEREQYGGGSSGGGGGGGRRGKDEEGKKNSVPPRMSRKARENESSRSQRQSPQKAIDHSPAHFPPLAGGSSSGSAPLPPSSNGSEQTVSNLADIVKGKHLKDTPTSLPSGNPVAPPTATPTTARPKEPASKTSSSSSISSTSSSTPTSNTSQPTQTVTATNSVKITAAPPSKPLTAVPVSSVPHTLPSTSPPATSSSSSSSSSSHPPSLPSSQHTSSKPISNGAPPSVQTSGSSSSGAGGAPQALPPKPQRAEVKVGSSKDSMRTGPNNKSQGSYSRSGDRDYNNREYNRTNKSQVFNNTRSDVRPPSTGRGRYRDRDRGDRERDSKRPGGNNYRGQQSKPSPKPLRKPVPPPPPTSPPAHPDKSQSSTTPSNNNSSSSSTSNKTPSTSCSDTTCTSSTNTQSSAAVKSDGGRLSYAQMAQKVPAPPPPKPPTQPQQNSNSTTTQSSGGGSTSSGSVTAETVSRDKEQAAAASSSERGSTSSSVGSGGKERENGEQTKSSRRSPESETRSLPNTPSKQPHSTQQDSSGGVSSNQMNCVSRGELAVATPLPQSPPSSSATSPDPSFPSSSS